MYELRRTTGRLFLLQDAGKRSAKEWRPLFDGLLNFAADRTERTWMIKIDTGQICPRAAAERTIQGETCC